MNSFHRLVSWQFLALHKTELILLALTCIVIFTVTALLVCKELKKERDDTDD